MTASVATSMFAVASSSTRMRFCRSSARARASSCRCPTEKLLPPSLTAASRPPSMARTTESICAVASAAHISTSFALPNGSMLYRTVPTNKVGSCGMMEMAARRSVRPKVPTSMPSMVMRPDASSTMRSSATDSDDLPAPVRPTMPTRVPAGTLKVRLRRTSGSPGLYRMTTFSKVTAPADGHEAGGFVSGTSAGASCDTWQSSPASPVYSRRRSRATRCVSFSAD
mmetsp:Transcript_2782/g.8970  ORF Transcript_2782/g.8970 Transcript_2782/m.8970 type:complete len:226 (-) Transcript_2782:963-1640(-)